MIDHLIDEINKSDKISLSRSFDIAKICSKLNRNPETQIFARQLVVYILENWSKIDNETLEMWANIVESVGFYPYIEKKELKLNNLSGEIRKNLHKTDCIDNIVFHEEQLVLKKIIDDGKNLIVSAPTSFGKSLLIEYIVASGKYKNIVVIQPTLALLDETRKKLKKYKESYKIIVRTSQSPDLDKGNLFLLTAERVMEYKDLPKVDFFIIDEFYKFSAKRDDERSDVLNNACYKLLMQHNAKFYFLGPNIDGISEGFSERFNAEFYKTDYSLIENSVTDIYSLHKGKFDQPRKYKKYKEDVLFNLLDGLSEEQTIIYCSSPARVRELATKFSAFLSNKGNVHIEELPLVEWIESNVHQDWNVIDFLKSGIGINDGALQKHINSSMIDYFNNGKLKYMFCTSTIIEGVNTSAKNVVIFDKKKGPNAIDFFDYSNIKGRSGRMMIHYIGNIYNFNEPPKKESEMIVDIPFFQQDPIKTEVLINLDDQDVLNKESSQYKDLNKLPLGERDLFKRNGVLVDGQIQILNEIRDLDKFVVIERRNHKKRYRVKELLSWNGMPKYDQLQYILTLCFDYLIKPTETVRPMTIGKLITQTFNYGIQKNLFALIEKDYDYKLNKNVENRNPKSEKEILNQSIREIFNTSRHWFKYKVPKWLNVINELQKYVFEKNGLTSGNYTHYASQIENDFVASNLVIFSEYGVPTSAIKKMAKYIPSELNEDQVLKYIKKNKLMDKREILKYERWKINQLL